MEVEKFDCVILAGGFGSRLSPITDTIPKPLVSVNNESVLSRLCRTLAENGFKKAAITTQYLSEQIAALSFDGLKTVCFHENQPLGSAGAVSALFDVLDDDVLVVSGDCVCDFRFDRIKKRHKAENRQATILLTRSKSPWEYGTVSLNSGIITSFCEKPSMRDTCSDLISTGIYIFNKRALLGIPHGVFYDFGKDLIPSLMSHREKIHGEICEGLWYDIGSIGEYYRCNMLFSGGKNCIDNNAVISQNALVESSIVYGGAVIGASSVKNSIVCKNAVIGDRCVVPSGCIIGAGSIIEDGATLKAGEIVGTGRKVTGEGISIERYFFRENASTVFKNDCLCLSLSEQSGCFFAKLGACLGKVRLGVMTDGSSKSVLLAKMLLLGASEAGCEGIDLKNGLLPLASFAAPEYGLDISAHISNDGESVMLRLFDRSGLPLSREKQRSIILRLKQPLYETVLEPILPSSPENSEGVYYKYLLFAREKIGTLAGEEMFICGDNGGCELLRSAAGEFGATVTKSDETSGYYVSDDGRRACAFCRDGKGLSYWHLVALVASLSSSVYLPRTTPLAVVDYLDSMGVTTHIYSDFESVNRRKAFVSPYINDGILLCLLTQKLLSDRKLSLFEAYKMLPEFFVLHENVECDEERAVAKISALSGRNDIARVLYKSGSVSCFLQNGGFYILAEAVSQEIAEELCAITRKSLLE